MKPSGSPPADRRHHVRQAGIDRGASAAYATGTPRLRRPRRQRVAAPAARPACVGAKARRFAPRAAAGRQKHTVRGVSVVRQSVRASEPDPSRCHHDRAKARWAARGASHRTCSRKNEKGPPAGGPQTAEDEPLKWMQAFPTKNSSSTKTRCAVRERSDRTQK